MSLAIEQRSWHTELKVLEAQKKVLKHNSQIPKKFKEVVSWIPRGPVQREEIQLLNQRILNLGGTGKQKQLPKETLSISLALVDKIISHPTTSPVSPLVSALNLDYPLCSTSLSKLPQNIDVVSYKALTSPKNYVECRAQYARLEKLIKNVGQAAFFVINPLRYTIQFKEPWAEDYSITIPPQTFDLIQHAYHNSIKPTPIRAPGSFSTIYKLTVNQRSIDNHYIIKGFKRTNDPAMELHFQREFNLLMFLKHPNILPCLAIDSHGLYFQEGTPFLKHLLDHQVSPSLLKKYFLQIANALNFVHEKGFTHKDVKPDNFIILNDNAYLIDLGLTCLTSDDQKTCGSLTYMAPEIVIRKKPYSNKVDSWSFGIALLQILLNTPIRLLKSPSKEDENAFVEAYLNKPLPINFFEKIKNPSQIEALKTRDPEGHFQKIIEGCLHGDVNKRLSMQEVIHKLEPIY